MHEETASAAVAAVECLFEANAGLGRFVLPDGELGRPGGNLYHLTFAVARPRKLLVEFDEQLLLGLTEPVVETVSSGHVRIAFEQLTFDWQEYGNLRPWATTYPVGCVDFYGQSRRSPGAPWTQSP